MRVPHRLAGKVVHQQIPLLEVGIKIHDAKKSEDLKPLHERLTIMIQ